MNINAIKDQCESLQIITDTAKLFFPLTDYSLNYLSSLNPVVLGKRKPLGDFQNSPTFLVCPYNGCPDFWVTHDEEGYRTILSNPSDNFSEEELTKQIMAVYEAKDIVNIIGKQEDDILFMFETYSYPAPHPSKIQNSRIKAHIKKSDVILKFMETPDKYLDKEDQNALISVFFAYLTEYLTDDDRNKLEIISKEQGKVIVDRSLALKFLEAYFLQEIIQIVLGKTYYHGMVHDKIFHRFILRQIEARKVFDEDVCAVLTAIFNTPDSSLSNRILKLYEENACEIVNSLKHVSIDRMLHYHPNINYMYVKNPELRRIIVESNIFNNNIQDFRHFRPSDNIGTLSFHVFAQSNFFFKNSYNIMKGSWLKKVFNHSTVKDNITGFVYRFALSSCVSHFRHNEASKEICDLFHSIAKVTDEKSASAILEQIKETYPVAVWQTFYIFYKANLNLIKEALDNNYIESDYILTPRF